MVKVSFNKMVKLLNTPKRGDVVIRVFESSNKYLRSFLVIEDYISNGSIIHGRGIDLYDIKGKVNVGVGAEDVGFIIRSNMQMISLYLFRGSRLYYFEGDKYDKSRFD